MSRTRKATEGQSRPASHFCDRQPTWVPLFHPKLLQIRVPTCNSRDQNHQALLFASKAPTSRCPCCSRTRNLELPWSCNCNEQSRYRIPGSNLDQLSRPALESRFDFVYLS